jgi:EmrB/QacA subfamily drug resistance transporter
MQSEPARAAASAGKIFAVVAVAVFLSILDLFIVNIAFPAIRADFSGSSLSAVSWVLNAYAIVYAALLVPAGKIGDIVGRRRVFAVGLVAFAAGSALSAAAPSIDALVAARVLQAAGAAAVTPTSLGLLLPAFPPERRAVAIGGWAAVGGVGAASGPPLGGLLTSISWHWIFIVNVPLALGAAAAAVRVLPEIRDPARPRLPDALGTLLLIAAVGLVTLGLVRGSQWNWDVRATACFAAAAVLTVALGLRSRRHPAPALELSILRVPAFALSSAAAALFFAAFAAMLLSNVIFLTSVWHYSAITAGFALTPGPLAAAALAPVSGRMAARYGPGLPGGLGAVIFVLSALWWIWQIGAGPEYAAAFLPGMVVGGVGVGLALPSFTVAATATLPPARLATGIGAQTMFRQIGAVLGVATFVAILGTPAPGDVLGAFNETRVFMAICAGAAALALVAISRVGSGNPVALSPRPAPAKS